LAEQRTTDVEAKMTVLAALGVGLAIGLVLGLLGGGGAILAVPGLVYILHAEPHAAVAASLAVVAVGALTGLLMHARGGRVAWVTALQLGATGAVGALAGTWLGQQLPGDRLLALLGLFMLAAAVLMVRRPSGTVAPAAVHPWKTASIGLGLGVVTGFFGVGGGFLIVPALTLLLRLPMRLAVGTSLTVIAMNSSAGLLGYLSGGQVDWALTALVSVGTVAGAVVGGRLAGTVPERSLRRGFAGLVTVVALYLVYRNAAAWSVALILPQSIGL
jgi:uncharacterized membrane protein YfcA